MEREYLVADGVLWRRNGYRVMRLKPFPSRRLILMQTYYAFDTQKGWLTPQEAREIATALNAYAEVIEKDLGYCHDPFATPEESGKIVRRELVISDGTDGYQYGEEYYVTTTVDAKEV